MQWPDHRRILRCTRNDLPCLSSMMSGSAFEGEWIPYRISTSENLSCHLNPDDLSPYGAFSIRSVCPALSPNSGPAMMHSFFFGLGLQTCIPNVGCPCLESIQVQQGIALCGDLSMRLHWNTCTFFRNLRWRCPPATNLCLPTAIMFTVVCHPGCNLLVPRRSKEFLFLCSLKVSQSSSWAILQIFSASCPTRVRPAWSWSRVHSLGYDRRGFLHRICTSLDCENSSGFSGWLESLSVFLLLFSLAFWTLSPTR